MASSSPARSPREDAGRTGSSAPSPTVPAGGTSAPAAPDEILVADDFDGTDSAVGTISDELTTESLRSSIFNYRLENNRTYHALSQGKYILPNDELENDRLDIQNHHLLLTFEGRQYFAPGADTAKRVLDVGTGTGIWAIEFAEDHPGAEVLGVDLSPIQPSFVPPNCEFEIDDIEKEWTWSKKFDYIFSRMMVGSFADWMSFVQKAYEHLEPGGWLEIIDCGFPIESDDGTLNDDQPIMKWIHMLIKASKTLGRDLTDARDHERRLTDTGFVNVERKLFKWPTNTWPRLQKHKEVGLWTLANIDGGLEGLSMALLTRGCGMTREEVLAFLVEVRKDLRDRNIHGYWPIYVTYGQKPET